MSSDHSWKRGLQQPGVAAALGAALLFGAGTPLAKLLLQAVNPWLLAGLLYLGSGLGMALIRRLTRASPVPSGPGWPEPSLQVAWSLRCC